MAEHKKWVIPLARIPLQPFKVIQSAAVVWLFLDRYKAPALLIGSLGMLYLIALIGVISVKIRQVEREPMFLPESAAEKEKFVEAWSRFKTIN